MTKGEAIQAMKGGAKVTHSHFGEEGWVKKIGCVYEFEDGFQCSESEFWGTRFDSSWLEGWEIAA